MQLLPGDLLLFYTDGISRIMQAAGTFAAGAPQHDDMTLAVARVVE